MNEEKVEEDIHEEDYEVEFEEVDEEIQKIPKLNLNRLMSARSTCSVKSRISLKSIKSSIGSRNEVMIKLMSMDKKTLTLKKPSLHSATNPTHSLNRYI